MNLKIFSKSFRTVYKCFDENNSIRCVKRIKLIKTTDNAATAHFTQIQQEIYLLQNLIHPRIIKLYSYFYSNDCDYIFIIMEYASYGSLAKLIAQQIKEDRFLNEKVSKIENLKKK